MATLGSDIASSSKLIDVEFSMAFNWSIMFFVSSPDVNLLEADSALLYVAMIERTAFCAVVISTSPSDATLRVSSTAFLRFFSVPRTV